MNMPMPKDITNMIDTDSLKTMFQPVVNLRTGEIISLETLVYQGEDFDTHMAGDIHSIGIAPEQETEIDLYAIEKAVEGYRYLESNAVIPPVININLFHSTVIDTASISRIEKLITRLMPEKGALRFEIPQDIFMQYSG